ncbi:unnamed protein product [Rhodiola kirilowii]
MVSDTSSYGLNSGAYSDEVDNQDVQLETESKQVIFLSESKQKIEELIMQEAFSREESDRLIQMIRSRTIEYGSTEQMKLDAEMPSLKPKTDTDLEVIREEPLQEMSIRRLRKMMKAEGHRG